MKQEKKDKYAKVLLHVYQSGLLKIVWTISGFSLGMNPNGKEIVSELKEKEFIDYAFSIIKIVMELAEEETIEDVSETDLEIAREIYKQEKDLKTHLYIKRNTKIHCFKRLESQIISYRKEENPKEIEADSAIIRMLIEKEDEDTSCVFEISRRDLGEMIDYLTELKEKLDSI